LGDEPIYDRAVEYVNRGYQFAIVPVSNDDGDEGVYGLAKNLDADKRFAAAALDREVSSNRLAAAMGLIFAARRSARHEGFQVF
jgi:hypothetical protein